MIDQAPDSISQYAISRVRYAISFGCTCSWCSCLLLLTGVYFLTHQALHGWCCLTGFLCSFLVFASLTDLEKLWDLLLCFNKVVFSLEATGVLLEISRDIASYIAISQEMYAGWYINSNNSNNQESNRELSLISDKIQSFAILFAILFGAYWPLITVKYKVVVPKREGSEIPTNQCSGVYVSL